MADCYAATQPDDRLWAKYMAEIERREQMSSRGFTPDEYALLKYSTEAHSALMEQTLGEEEAFTTRNSTGDPEDRSCGNSERNVSSVRRRKEARARREEGRGCTPRTSSTACAKDCPCLR